MTRRDIVIDVLEFRNPADVQLGKGLTRPAKKIKHFHRQLIKVLPVIIANYLLTPVGMLAKTGSWEFRIVNPSV